MSNLSVFSTIEERVKKYKQDFSLENGDKAFQWFALESIMNLNESEIEDALT